MSPSVQDDALPGLLGRWLALGDLQGRAFQAMAEEIHATSGLIEGSTADLTARFRDLAHAATAQAERVRHVATIAREVDVGGRRLPTSDVVGIVETAALAAGDAFRRLTGQAETMVRALDDVVADMAEVEKLVTHIEGINTKARYVALNAAIEAHRGEQAGGTFKVIAHELKDLSQQTDAISRQVRDQVAAIAGAVRAAHGRLRDIAGLGTGDDGTTRATLASVLAGLLAQNDALHAVLEETSTASDDIAGTVARLVTGAQFQDRASQHLAHVSDALESLGAIGERLRCETSAAVPALAPGGVDQMLIENLLDRQTLSAVRGRFLERLTGATAGIAPADAGGEVELF